MSLGHATARYECTDTTLHNWTVAAPTFFPTNSGPSEFFPLPTAPDGIDSGNSAGPKLTHVLAGIMPPKPYRGGTAWYTLGSYMPGGKALANTTPPRALDYSNSECRNGHPSQPRADLSCTRWLSAVLIFTQMHVDDGRMLFMGWWNVGLSCLTAPREVTYDPLLRTLRALPVKELALLRGDKLSPASAGPRTVHAGGDALSLFKAGAVSTTFDVEAEIALPSAPVSFALVVMAASPTHAEVLLNVTVGTASGSVRNVTVTAGVPGAGGRSQAAYNSSFSFELPATETTLAVRILADRTLVEAFVGGGRGVVTTPVLAPGKDPTKAGCFLSAGVGGSVTVNSYEAYEMGCGWAQYP